MAEDDSDTYWVMSREELQCLGSPRRYDIVDHLAALRAADDPAYTGLNLVLADLTLRHPSIHVTLLAR